MLGKIWNIPKNLKCCQNNLEMQKKVGHLAKQTWNVGKKLEILLTMPTIVEILPEHLIYCQQAWNTGQKNLKYYQKTWNIAKKLEILPKTWNIAKKLEILR